MAQHFLLSAKARTLSLGAIMRMSDDEAHARFVAIWFASNAGEAFCPRCECTAVYTYAARRIWKCKACNRQFSVTSGTIFSSRKLPIRDYLAAIAIFVNAVKGISALQLGRDLDVQYKTAFVLAHKLREAIGATQSEGELTGTVEIDGAYVGGHSRPENEAADRTDRRAEHPTGRQSVVIARERGGRTLPTVVAKEADAVPFIRQHVAPGAVVHADEAPGWDRLHAHYEMRRINHSVAYSLDGACTNWAESFFSRLRRAELGQHHHISGPYLISYAREMAWKEDHRRVPNGAQHEAVVGAALAHPVSRVWAGYWQRAWR
ncbi:MAG TPA: IS1595 family transposase [Acetobacteraceae bacterium]|nr:IS1595 family transposase [Acetobacteraceae bacterium]